MRSHTANLYLAWLLALVATLGSLYFSEVRHFVPCQLCWYQRILMYPLVVVLGIASYKQDRDVTGYTLPLSLLGVGVSLFHYLDQKIPGFGPPGLCSSGVPCNTSYIDWFGFVTIPFLALIAFSGISVALGRVALASRPGRQAATASQSRRQRLSDDPSRRSR